MLLQSVKSSGYKQVLPALSACVGPVLKSGEIPGATASVCAGLYHPVTDFPFYTTRWKWTAMIGHILLLLLLSVSLDVQPCYLLPPINSNYLPRQIRSHMHMHPHGSVATHTRCRRQQNFCNSNKIILPLNLISTTSTVDKLHSSVIKADLA